ncbi:HlyD family secretion protein [Anthocerotibacter panamensis]|uniref:HlyD family secretion protein n=1 Tax=Anthocerotibacter panamensis TaxID=2857077 RepID=UPI001C40459A|nr:efflux RND transporter periplasmic adaptor subunit [Anthocerotibacter panamensis]
MSPTLDASSPTRKLNPRLLIPLGLLLIGCVAVAWYFLNRPKEGRLMVSGRLEGYETDLGARVPGRINAVTVREGDQVMKGEILVRLDDAEVQAQLQGANARVQAAREQARQARLQVDVLISQVRAAEIALTQSQGDTEGRLAQADSTVAQAEAQLAQAEARLLQAQAEVKLARLNRERFQKLLSMGAINQQQFDQIDTALVTAQARVRAEQAGVTAARKQISASQGALVQAQTTRLNPDLRSAQRDVLRKQLVQARSQEQAAQSEVKNAESQSRQVQAQIAYLKVVSPLDGVVTARSVEPGAVVAQGKTLLTLLDLNMVYLRGFVPEGSIGQVKVGQWAQVYLDSAPTQGLSAKVIAIDPEASFTPENIYFRDDRVKQVFGVKIALESPGGFAKPGMPAEAEIDTTEEPTRGKNPK